MRLFVLPLILFLVFNAVVDYYIFRALSSRWIKYPWIKWSYAILSVLCISLVVVALCLPLKAGEDNYLLAINWLLYIYLTIYVPKYLYIIFDVLSKIPLLFKKHRLKWLGRAGAVIAGVLFILMWWGALINRYRIDVKEVTIQIKDLPKSFEGFRILQFSDFHVGTYGENVAFVKDVVETINKLNPDAIVFTGDIVNRHTSELYPFVDELAKITTSDSVRAILGNHDYGDYFQWDNREAKKANMEELYSLFGKMGWKLLRNQTDWLVRGQDSIAMIGVENIGDHPFPVYGSLKKAYPDTDDSKIKILLSHNPAHWVDSISNHDNVNIDLTLSGHTHAMQIAFGHFSPASWRYKTWGGLYEDESAKHQLYVNIGLGTVGIPMRLGATPELTLITLKSR